VRARSIAVLLGPWCSGALSATPQHAFPTISCLRFGVVAKPSGCNLLHVLVGDRGRQRSAQGEGAQRPISTTRGPPPGADDCWAFAGPSPYAVKLIGPNTQEVRRVRVSWGGMLSRSPAFPVLPRICRSEGCSTGRGAMTIACARSTTSPRGLTRGRITIRSPAPSATCKDDRRGRGVHVLMGFVVRRNSGTEGCQLDQGSGPRSGSRGSSWPCCCRRYHERPKIAFISVLHQGQ